MALSITMQMLFDLMVEENASDVHITVGRPPVVRRHGRLKNIKYDKLTPPDTMLLVESITPERMMTEFLEQGSADFGYAHGRRARFRVAIFRQRGHAAMVARLIPNRLMTFDEIGLPHAVRSLCERPRGLILVMGPTGSGKTTTLATMVDAVNTTLDRHILTIEDPIEYYHDHKKWIVNQREVGAHTQGFKRALRAALREDPDIVLVGEMRDLETVAIAIETAETGHLVFGTLHTNTAPSTVDRIIDQFSADRQAQVRTMLAESLKGVIAQTLCKKITSA